MGTWFPEFGEGMTGRCETNHIVFLSVNRSRQHRHNFFMVFHIHDFSGTWLPTHISANQPTYLSAKIPAVLPALSTLTDYGCESIKKRELFIFDNVKWQDGLARTVVEIMVPVNWGSRWARSRWALDISETLNTTLPEAGILARQQGIFRLDIEGTTFSNGYVRQL